MATASSTTTSQVDPTIQPFLSYGLTEAQRLYQAGGPQYYPGQTYVGPSETTQTGLQALEQRARMGSPLLRQAQGTVSGFMGSTINPAMAGTQATASGQFLGGNPFFQGAFAPAAQAATQQFQTSIGDIGSAASKAGRYGSGAMGTLQERASGQLAKSLSDTAGQLAYQNYAAERGMQESAIGRLAGLSQQDIANRMAAAGMAPGLAQADYQDIQNLLAAGQAREGYTGQQTAADIARYNFGQQAPQQQLATFLSSVYGNPLTRNTQATASGSNTSGLQNLLGIAAVGGGLYKNIGGTAGLSSIGNWLGSFGSPSVVDPYANLSQYDYANISGY